LFSLSYDDEIDYVVNSNISLLMIGFVLLFVYVALVLGNLNLVEQRVRTAKSSFPDPDPPDPHVFGPPGSGSISQMDPDPDPSIRKQKQ
jgi:hypothetical protein